MQQRNILMITGNKRIPFCFQIITFHKVASRRLVYYSILNSLGQRSQYISFKFPIHKQSENNWVCHQPRQCTARNFMVSSQWFDFCLPIEMSKSREVSGESASTMMWTLHFNQIIRLLFQSSDLWHNLSNPRGILIHFSMTKTD